MTESFPQSNLLAPVEICCFVGRRQSLNDTDKCSTTNRPTLLDKPHRPKSFGWRKNRRTFLPGVKRLVCPQPDWLIDFDYQRNTQPINHNMAFAPFDSLVIIEASAVRQLASFDRLSPWSPPLVQFPCQSLSVPLDEALDESKKLGLIRSPFVK